MTDIERRIVDADVERLMDLADEYADDACKSYAYSDRYKQAQTVESRIILHTALVAALNAAATSATASTRPPDATVERLMDLARIWVAAYANAYAISMKRGTDESDWEIQERAEAALRAALVAALRTPPPQEGGNHGAEATRQHSDAPAVRDVAVRSVPREPTQWMFQAFWTAWPSVASHYCPDRPTVTQLWQAMYDAAPQSEATDTARLRDALRKYGRHQWTCPMSPEMLSSLSAPLESKHYLPCTCGLDAAMQGNTDKT